MTAVEILPILLVTEIHRTIRIEISKGSIVIEGVPVDRRLIFVQISAMALPGTCTCTV